MVTGRTPRSVFDHFEGDVDRRIERVCPARLEVLASIEHESVDAGFKGSVIVHQCALPAILVSLSMAENPPLAVLAAPFEDDPQARGRTTNRGIEHVRGDCAHGGIVACWFGVRARGWRSRCGERPAFRWKKPNGEASLQLANSRTRHGRTRSGL